MSDEKTAEAKLAEAEAKLTEQQTKLDELQRKLESIPNNPEHFNQLKAERDEAKKKLKDLEDAEATAKGEFERLATDRLTQIEQLKGEKAKLEEVAGKWTNYEKARREVLLGKITDKKKKEFAEQLSTLKALEEFVELEQTIGAGSGNHTPTKPETNKSPIKYPTMKK